MATGRNDYRHVDYLWQPGQTAELDAVDQLVYRSNLLGTDQRITNTGGGNTSSKVIERDPLTGEEVEVLWVKGSGGDLRTSRRANFASLYLNRVLSLEAIYNTFEPRGPKTEAEDRMVFFYPHCTFNLNPRACSIDTPLHVFVPVKHIDHMHPNSVIAVAAAKNGERLTKEIFGEEIAWTPWQRPGFDLGLKLRDIHSRQPGLKGVILGKHGVINWDDDPKACYDLTLDLIEKAARYIEAHDKGENTFGGAKYRSLDNEARDEILVQLLPWLRGRVSQQNRFIATVQSDSTILRFVNSVDAARLAELGTSCPDHFLRTKIKPLYVEWDPALGDFGRLKQLLDNGLATYRADYQEYYERCKRPDSPAMRDPNPTAILIPGIGMIAFGKNKSESRVTAEFYNCAVEVMRGAEAIDEYIALPQQEAFDIEYWALEEAKLKRMPPENEFARRVVVVVGAGAGIGRAVAHRMADEGAHIVCADLNPEAAQQTANEIIGKRGEGIGVAGSGVSRCGPAIACEVDVRDRRSVARMMKQAIFAYGGIDHVAVTAGVYVPPTPDGRIDDNKWRLTFDVNVIGAYLVMDEARRIWLEQGLRGSAVITTSVNAVVPKAGSLAYDTSKTAANHLVRELAIELAPLVRINAVAPATVVEGSTMFPRDRVIASLTKYGIEFDPDVSTEDLRASLADFYAGRTLTGEPVTPADQAEAVCFLLSGRSAKTTGQVLPVDGGLKDAFVR